MYYLGKHTQKVSIMSTNLIASYYFNDNGSHFHECINPLPCLYKPKSYV